MQFFEAINFGWLDLIDIGLVTIVIYLVILLVKGSRMASALAGILSLGIAYLLSEAFGLYTLNWILESFFSSLFLMIIILFHEDIRQAFSKMGVRSFWYHKKVSNINMIDDLVWVCEYFAKRKTGALIVIEGKVLLNDMMQGAVILDAKLSRELLLTIFFHNTALHDGAVIIRDGIIAAAGCILPLAKLDRQHFGTRHRAAIGISEASDAIVLVVSEERGEISVAMRGRLYRVSPDEPLKEILSDALKLY